MLENELTRPDFSQRATAAVNDSTALLNHAGKKRAQIIAAHSEVVCSEKNKTVAFDRADRHVSPRKPRTVRVADIKVTIAKVLIAHLAVAEKLNPRLAARGFIKKLNRAAYVAARAGVGD